MPDFFASQDEASYMSDDEYRRALRHFAGTNADEADNDIAAGAELNGVRSEAQQPGER
ncbi:hypothetical protein ACFFK0_29680 [Paenibacillus chartarius]|uniref:YfhD family protein n=1 Tax=Paenibacillus chartarius TaxID=747481 RepID=A0ABV6DVA1_9BACL